MTDSSETPITSDVRLKMRLRLKASNGLLVMGPGRLEILRRIEANGSIAAAAREMGMSYRRAWTLVDATNHCFREPLVESVAGGRRGGGAQLTALGHAVLEIFTVLNDKAAAAVADELAALEAVLAVPLPAPKPGSKA